MGIPLCIICCFSLAAFNMCFLCLIFVILINMECNEVSSSEFWGVYGFGMALCTLSFKAQGCVPALLESYCGMSCTRTSWLLDGAWFPCRYKGFWVNSCLLIFPGIRSSLMFSSLGIKPPASGFQSHYYSSLKTSPSIQPR